mmetsp:Transcript_2370/g.3630  ORF Transcript_2370/g.3630 Transcript_2370/m.3630 type:complete len:80 (+) Transcript_2370:236-475(+)
MRASRLHLSLINHPEIIEKTIGTSPPAMDQQASINRGSPQKKNTVTNFADNIIVFLIVSFPFVADVLIVLKWPCSIKYV